MLRLSWVGGTSVRPWRSEAEAAGYPGRTRQSGNGDGTRGGGGGEGGGGAEEAAAAGEGDAAGAEAGAEGGVEVGVSAGWSSAWATGGWLLENPLGVPTEREVQNLSQGKPCYRVMLVRTDTPV